MHRRLLTSILTFFSEISHFVFFLKKTSLCVCLNENQSHLHAKGLSFLFLNGSLCLSYRWMGCALIPWVPLWEVTSRSVYSGFALMRPCLYSLNERTFALRWPSWESAFHCADCSKASLTSRLQGEQPLHFLPSLRTGPALAAAHGRWQQRIAVAAGRGLAHSKPLVNKSTL